MTAEPTVARPSLDATDPFALTAQLVDVASESFAEQHLTDLIEAELRRLDHLDVTRIGDNVVTRTSFGRDQRLVLGGHTDTVPANANFPGRIDGDVLHGVGSADMKGGLAIMLTSARRHVDPTVDLTYVFYAREEVAAVHSGLGELFAERPDLLAGDLALLGEPTDGAVEAGCQGSLRLRVTLAGQRAHPARAWMGDNAVHRAGPLLDALAAYVPRRPTIAGCDFHEALLAVSIEGGVSGNVVPDSVTVRINHRFAPDRSIDEATEHARSVLAPFLRDGDVIEVEDAANAAFPSTNHPMLRRLVDANDLVVRAKLGWTDVARFAAHGMPAANFGPGDPTLAHTAEERVTRDSVERTWRALDALVSSAV